MAQSSDLGDLSAVSSIIKNVTSLGPSSCHSHRTATPSCFPTYLNYMLSSPLAAYLTSKVLTAAQTSQQHPAFKEWVLFSFINLPMLKRDLIALTPES